MDNNRQIISTEEAATLLGITRQTLYKLSEKGQIPGKKVGGQYKFFREEIMNYLNTSKPLNEDYVEWELKGDFATEGIKKMAKRTFQELASNIEELIANSYDADATQVEVTIDYDKKTLSIIDDGNGMDEEALASYVIYGESRKTSEYKSPKFGRAPIGEYGMGGKLAITNICSLCKIITRRNGKEHVFSMNREDLNKAKYLSQIKNKVISKKCEPGLQGTLILMEKLFSKNIDSDRLIERFSTKMPNSQNFKILLALIKDGERKVVEIKESLFDYDEKFEFEENLKLIGSVKMAIYFTKEPIPSTKQGIWTKVNGRIVNEKAEWFDLFKATSGNRYRYRLFGYGEADGLKNFVTFSKNDFIDCPEYREYWDFGHKNIVKVQNTLLKRDEDLKKELDRDIIKNVEKEVNDIVSRLDDPEVLGELESKIKKEFTKEKEAAPDTPYADIEEIEKEASRVASNVKRGKDKRERRNQSLTSTEKLTYSGRNYIITTVDLSEKGDLIKFSKDKNVIEINERHPLFIKSSKEDSLDSFIRDLAFTEIAVDYSEGSVVIFDNVFNTLARFASEKINIKENPEVISLV